MIRSVGLVLPVLLSAAGAVGAAEPECSLEPISQRYQWTRQLQGVHDPVEWTVSRDLAFSEAQVDGYWRAVETFQFELPRFGTLLQRHLDSARVDRCDVRFDILARTVTVRGSRIGLPMMVRFDRTTCGSNGQRGKSIDSAVAEIDVDYEVEFQASGLSPVIQSRQSPVYGELVSEMPKRLFGEVIAGGAAALEAILGSLSVISLAQINPEFTPVRVSSGFTEGNPALFQLTAVYRLDDRQACTAVNGIRAYGSDHRSAKES